jgi:N6-adenosine-specific RNA methylase IME4
VSRWLLKGTGEEVQSLGGFGIILADPCWRYRVQGGRGAADKQYKTMSLAELSLLPVEKLAAPDAVLFMWGVWPMLLEAGALMKVWGFDYLNCGFIWVKTNPVTPTPFFGMGHWTRGNAEFCLMGKRGKPKRVDAAVQQIVENNLIVAPVEEHSAKPEEVRRRIECLMGKDLPAIELFARRPAADWECFGDEVESTVVLEP